MTLLLCSVCLLSVLFILLCAARMAMVGFPLPKQLRFFFYKLVGSRQSRTKKFLRRHPPVHERHAFEPLKPVRSKFLPPLGDAVQSSPLGVRSGVCFV